MKRLLCLLLPLLSPLAACLPGSQPTRPKALDGLAPVAATETRNASGQLVVSAGELELRLGDGWMPIRMGGQVQYANVGAGEQLKLSALASPSPLDGERQRAVLAAEGEILYGVEKLMGRFGGKGVGPPRMAREPWGLSTIFDAQGPLARRAIHYVGVTPHGSFTISVETSRPERDLAGDAQKILAAITVKK